MLLVLTVTILFPCFTVVLPLLALGTDSVFKELEFALVLLLASLSTVVFYSVLARASQLS